MKERASGYWGPSGMVSVSVSWIAHLPRCAAVVQADNKMILAPSPRAASIPVSALVKPGPVVSEHNHGGVGHEMVSIAAKAALVSCRKWMTFISLWRESAPKAPR